MDIVEGFSEVYNVYTQFSLSFCALFNTVSESEALVCTTSSFS